MAIIAGAFDGPPDTTDADSHLIVIPREEWVRALNGFTRCHDGWLVSFDIIPPQGTPQREFENLPLLGVSTDRLDHDGTLAISVSRSRSEHLTHIVHSVERLSIERTAAPTLDASDVGSRSVRTTNVIRPMASCGCGT